MNVRRRLDPALIRASTPSTVADRPPPPEPADRSVVARRTAFDGVLRAETPDAPGRSARLLARDVHHRTMAEAVRLRDAGDTERARGLLAGLRIMSASRGVPTDEAFLAGANTATPPPQAGPDRMESVLSVLQGEPVDDAHRIVPSLRLGWLNDQFFFPNGDDDGFTQAAGLGLTLRRGDDTLDLDVRHGMLTERGGDHRVDELDVVAAVSRRVERGNLEWTFGSHMGLSLVGDYGGDQLQDGFHGLIGMGRRLDGTLQHTYDGPNSAALIVGANVEARGALGAGFSASGGFDGQLAVGPTGVSHVSPHVGVDFEWPKTGIRPVASVDLTVARFFTPDARLQMAGGYDTRHFEAIPRFSIGLRTDHFEIGWQGTANQNGSGANMGNIYLAIGRR